MTVHHGDCLEVLRTLPDESVQCCVTSPPYLGLRDYGVAGQLGLEPTPQAYATKMVEVFREVRRVLREDGTLWLNLGDSYASSPPGNVAGVGSTSSLHGANDANGVYRQTLKSGHATKRNTIVGGLKPKDLVGIPWMVAFALRDDGWYLRSEITWCKRAPMPESVTDRPTSATEKIFLFSKSADYYYDANAVRNPPSQAMLDQVADGYEGTAMKLFEDNGVQNASEVKSRIIDGARKRIDKQRGHSRRHDGFNDRWDHLTKAEQMACGSNMRNYWVLGPEPFPDAHFATFPTEIPRRCILAGCPVGGTVLDPFAGSGTTGLVALELARKAVLIELNPAYAKLIEQRTNITPGLPLAT